MAVRRVATSPDRTTALIRQQLDEEERVFDWRMRWLTEMGFTEVQATPLAIEISVSHERVKTLLARGWSHAQVVAALA